MSNFLRTIRTRLLTGGPFNNILIYVIAEIFFVVIGILVAFQLDKWNDARNTRQEEVVLLKALRREMNDNAIQLKEVISYNDRSGQSAHKLSEIYHNDFQQYKPETLDSLLGQVQWAWTFNPKLSVLNSIKLNRKIDAIENPAIQEFISSFEEIANDSEEESLITRSLIVDKYVLAVSKYVSVSARAKYLGFNLGESKFPSDYKGIFNDRELESLLSYIYIWRQNEGKELNKLHQLLLQEIDVVDIEIKK
jgi:hypothetical protein